MNADAYYAAVCARDARFDGRFFVGVHSTGIYCRPICPSRTPRRRGITFFHSAAAAEAAGFRACRRCRPDAAPGSPAWTGTHATVRRALRLIQEGALDVEDVDALAARLGMSARQLRRLFRQHAGASPHQFARTRRAHFARQLLTRSSLPMTRIAEAAGFRSLRTFNDAIRQSFDATPTELRRGASTAENGPEMHFALAPPYDSKSVLRFFGGRLLSPMETLEDGVYRRFFSEGGHSGYAAVSFDEHVMRVTLETSLAGAALYVTDRLRFMFDVDADGAALRQHFADDPVLGDSAGAVRVAAYASVFEAAVRAVVGQQISVAAAATILRRLLAKYGEGGRAFPTPERLAEGVQVDGLNARREQTLVDVARFFLGSDRLDVERFETIVGIGPWTVANVSLRGLRDPDAFPASDLVLKRALKNVSEKTIEGWRPFRAYAAVCLWDRARKEKG
ncbi:MAG: Ada metal-binding domain-containing protein [Myxococcota bacterium]